MHGAATRIRISSRRLVPRVRAVRERGTWPSAVATSRRSPRRWNKRTVRMAPEALREAPPRPTLGTAVPHARVRYWAVAARPSGGYRSVPAAPECQGRIVAPQSIRGSICDPGSFTQRPLAFAHPPRVAEDAHDFGMASPHRFVEPRRRPLRISAPPESRDIHVIDCERRTGSPGVDEAPASVRIRTTSSWFRRPP